MIRINLLAQKREARRDFGQGWLLVMGLALVGEFCILVLYHQMKLQELDKQKQANAELESQIAQIESAVKNHATVKQQLELLRAREDAILKLQQARSGPTGVLLELAKLMTPGRGPTVDPDRLAQLSKDNPTAVFNPAWDSRRLWLSGYKEHDRTLDIDGCARDGEDVSELARRLALSNFFSDVKLLPAHREIEPTSKTEMVRFQLQAKVRY